jgi:hypothetical protein
VNAIKQLLLRQRDDWNKGNVAAFMKGYWESDSLLFIGKSVSNGYQKHWIIIKKVIQTLLLWGILIFNL